MLKFVEFPDLNNTDDEGLLCMGGDLSTDTLVSAYQQGVFPWFSEGQPILWWSPDPRLVLFPNEVRISKSLSKLIRQQRFHVTCDTAFSQVINACAQINRKGQKSNTWITNNMQNAYIDLHKAGYAHSIEVWQDGNLAGGLYGIALGDVFFGESMFAHVSNASKLGFAQLCLFLQEQNFTVVDCQVHTDHLSSLGAREIERNEFIGFLTKLDIQQPNMNFGENFNQWIKTAQTS